MAGKSFEFITTGIEEIDQRLDQFDRKARNRIARGALSKGAQIGAKLTKRQIPSLQKNVRKAIGHSTKKGRHGSTVSKFGTAGKRGASRKHSSKGVGITKENVHWYLLGTGRRSHKSGKYTGKMPAHDVVARATRSGLAEIRTEMIKRAEKLFDKEAAKLGR